MVIFEHGSCVENKPSGNLSKQSLGAPNITYSTLPNVDSFFKITCKGEWEEDINNHGDFITYSCPGCNTLDITKWLFCDNVIWTTFEHVHISFTSANQVDKVECFVVMRCPSVVYMIGAGFIFSFRIHFWIISSHIWMQRIQPTKSHPTLGIISCSMKLNPWLEAKSIFSETAKSIPIDSKWNKEISEFQLYNIATSMTRKVISHQHNLTTQSPNNHVGIGEDHHVSNAGNQKPTPQ